jgi:methyl-accepting chemotaxis protein
LRRLEREVAGHARVLPLLCEQLGETARQVEASVVTVCGQFQQIAERAQHSVAHAQGFDCVADHDDAEAAGVAAIGEAATETLRHLLDRVAHSSELSMRAAAGMERIEQSMRQVTRVLGDVDRLATSTRILALNAAIEAARSGEHGQAFGVVAGEMARTAADSGRTSESIRDIVTALGREVAGLSSEMRTLATANLQEATASRADIEGVLEALTGANERLRLGLQESAASSEALARDISRAVMTLQFQDAVSQRVGHVVSALHVVHEGLSGRLPRRERSAQGPRHVVESYTMQAERDTHARHFGEPQATASSSAAGSVELF